MHWWRTGGALFCLKVPAAKKRLIPLANLVFSRCACCDLFSFSLVSDDFFLPELWRLPPQFFVTIDVTTAVYRYVKSAMES